MSPPREVVVFGEDSIPSCCDLRGASSEHVSHSSCLLLMLSDQSNVMFIDDKLMGEAVKKLLLPVTVALLHKRPYCSFISTSIAEKRRHDIVR